MKTARRNLFLALFYFSFVLSILTATEKTFGGQVGTVVAAETFYGQLVIALIAAVPPTGMMIVALITLKRGQTKQQENQAEMALALDGKLEKLMKAEKGVSKAEGVKEERAEERARVESVPTTPTKVEIVQPVENPAPRG